MMKKKKMIYALATVLVVGLTTPISAASPKLSQTSLTLVPKEKKTLTVSGTKKKITWSSSRKAVVTVSKKGVVSAKKVGAATITAKIAGKKLKCKVVVKKKQAKKPISSSDIVISDHVERKIPKKTYWHEQMSGYVGETVDLLFTRFLEGPRSEGIKDYCSEDYETEATKYGSLYAWLKYGNGLNREDVSWRSTDPSLISVTKDGMATMSFCDAKKDDPDYRWNKDYAKEVDVDLIGSVDGKDIIEINYNEIKVREGSFFFEAVYELNPGEALYKYEAELKVGETVTMRGITNYFGDDPAFTPSTFVNTDNSFYETTNSSVVGIYQRLNIGKTKPMLPINTPGRSLGGWAGSTGDAVFKGEHPGKVTIKGLMGDNTGYTAVEINFIVVDK